MHGVESFKIVQIFNYVFRLYITVTCYWNRGFIWIKSLGSVFPIVGYLHWDGKKYLVCF